MTLRAQLGRQRRDIGALNARLAGANERAAGLAHALDAKEKELELLALLALTPIEIWQTDLDAFLAQWKVKSIVII